MSATVDTVSFDALLRDLHPLPGQRVRQWVVDTRKREEWKRATAPRIHVSDHMDNTGIECRNGGSVPVYALEHDCCGHCNDVYAVAAGNPEVAEWLAELAKRPPVCEDRTKYSDEIEPNWFATTPMRRLLP